MLDLLIAPLVGLAAIIFIGLCANATRWHLRRNARRSPITRELLRGAGHTLSRQIDELSFDFFTYLAMAPVVLAALVSWLPKASVNDNGNASALIAMAVGVAAFTGWKVVVMIRRLQRLRIGLESERAAAEELNLLMARGFRVFHDLPGEDRFNIDHVLVGPSGVYAVETKGRLKPESRDGKEGHRAQSDGRTIEFPTWRETKPISQAERNAQWLAKWLSSAIGEPVQVHTMVVLPGWYVTRTRPDGVPVLNPKEVRNFLAARDRAALTDKQVRQIVHQLDARCRDIAPVVSVGKESVA